MSDVELKVLLELNILEELNIAVELKRFFDFSVYRAPTAIACMRPLLVLEVRSPVVRFLCFSAVPFSFFFLEFTTKKEGGKKVTLIARQHAGLDSPSAPAGGLGRIWTS